jgi:hypothetical protein
MGDFVRFREPIWDRFFDFIYEDDENLTDSQVDEELRCRGIDVTRAFGRVQQALQSAKARTELEAARKSRPKLLQQFQALAGASTGAALDELRRLISNKQPGGQIQAAFRKLETTASEEDIRSLLDDIHRLDELAGGAGDAGTETE